MSTSELLDRTFHLYRNHFRLFSGIAGLVPALLLATKLVAIAAGVPIDYGSGFRGDTTLLFLLELAMYFVGAQLSYGATVYAVSMVHMGKQTTVLAAFNTIRPYWGKLIGVSVRIARIMVGFGMVAVGSLFLLRSFALLAIPLLAGWAFHLYVRYSLAGAACVLENTSTEGSLERSSFLTKKAAGRIWLIFLLTGILSAALSYALRVPADILRMHLGQSSLIVMVSKPLGAFFAQTLAGPIGTISLVLMYYDQRIRKEAFDLEVMMQSLEQGRLAQSGAVSSPI
jgi:hypothetical protein